MILCETIRVEMFNYFWLDLKSWEVRKQYVSTLVDRIPIKQKDAKSNSRRTNVHVPIIIIYNYVAVKRIKFVLGCFLTLLVCHQEPSVTGFLPLLVITHLLQRLLQKQFSQLLQRLLQKQFLLKPNLLKYLAIKCHKNVKNLKKIH